MATHALVYTALTTYLVRALALGPDGAVWAATDEGVSRLRERHGAVEITNFAGLENVPGPVRDMVIDATGTVWLATDAGLFRLQPGGGSAVAGTTRAASGPRLIPVAGNNQSTVPGQELPTPLVVRLEGTNVDLGKKILAESGLPIISGNNMADAAEKVVAAASKRA